MKILSYLSILLFWLACLIQASPIYAKGAYYYGSSTVSASSSPDCFEYFTTGDNGDVAGNTEFDAESDVNSKLSIGSNELVSDVGEAAQVGYVSETTCLADTDTIQTHKFTIKFDDITAIDNDTSYDQIWELRDDAGTQVQARGFIRAVGGNIATFNCQLVHNGGTATSTAVTMTGIAEDTEYQVVIYWTKSATAIASIKVGAWAASETTANDNTGLNGGGTSRLGAIDHNWGDGTTDTFVRMDDYEIYKSDQR